MAKHSSEFLTPIITRTKKVRSDKNASPLVIPSSPSMKKLGYGTGVNVYLMERFSPLKGCYKSPWAIKKINRELQNQNSEFTKRLEDEAKILQSLEHPNIIGYRSQGNSVDGSLCLVMESGQKSLADLIEERLDLDLGPLEACHIMKVAQSLAAGLDYLHRKHNLLHGDLKSANVLIKGKFDQIKLCDFGVTLKLNEKLIVEDPEQSYIGTECWSAPEAIHGGTMSDKTDMFSYGLILWEMIALCPPHQDKLYIDSFLLDTEDEAKIDELNAKNEEEFQKVLGTRPDIPDFSLGEGHNQVIELFYMCTNEEAIKRPSAKQILDLYFTNKD